MSFWPFRTSHTDKSLCTSGSSGKFTARANMYLSPLQTVQRNFFFCFSLYEATFLKLAVDQWRWLCFSVCSFGTVVVSSRLHPGSVDFLQKSLKCVLFCSTFWTPDRKSVLPCNYFVAPTRGEVSPSNSPSCHVMLLMEVKLVHAQNSWTK